MLLGDARVIFLHLPKTAGNSIQTVLEPVSDDRRAALDHQDGRDRFAIVGPVTPGKHATLSEYAARLGPSMAGHRVAIGCREPFERALALYFSPHGWLKRGADGSWRQKTPRWDRDRFLALVANMRTAADFLRVDGQIVRPDWVIRFENLAGDFSAFVRKAGIPVDPAGLPHVNASAAADECEKDLARRDPSARDAVLRKLGCEYELFRYAEAPAAP